MKEERIKGWHFLRSNRRLGYGDNREVKAGRILSVDCEPRAGVRGLHAAKTLRFAAFHASESSPIVCRVEVWGNVSNGAFSVFAAQNRKVLWLVDFRDFAAMRARKIIGKLYKDVWRDHQRAWDCGDLGFFLDCNGEAEMFSAEEAFVAAALLVLDPVTFSRQRFEIAHGRDACWKRVERQLAKYAGKSL